MRERLKPEAGSVASCSIWGRSGPSDWIDAINSGRPRIFPVATSKWTPDSNLSRPCGADERPPNVKPLEHRARRSALADSARNTAASSGWRRWADPDLRDGSDRVRGDSRRVHASFGPGTVRGASPPADQPVESPPSECTTSVSHARARTGQPSSTHGFQPHLPSSRAVGVSAVLGDPMLMWAPRLRPFPGASRRRLRAHGVILPANDGGWAARTHGVGPRISSSGHGRQARTSA